MSASPWNGIARVFKSRNAEEPVGAGFLVGDAYVVTCAHNLGSERPTGEVWLDFPFLRDGERHTATVHPRGWWPYRASPPLDGRADVAVLELQEPLATIAAFSLAREAPRALGVRAYGFPEDHSIGHWMKGDLAQEARADGWLQLSGRSGINYFIRPGFSGAPVFAEQGEQVLGMVSQYETGGQHEAFLVPASLLRELLEQLESPRSDTPKKGTAAELITWIRQLGWCADNVQQQTNDWQIAEMIRRLAGWCENSLVHHEQLGLEPLMRAYPQLERLKNTVEKDDRLGGCFEPVPLAAFLASLDRFLDNTRPPAAGQAVIIPNDIQAEPPPPHDATLTKLLAEIEQLCARLQEEPWQLVTTAFLPALNDLMALSAQLHEKEVQGREVEATRSRLEQLKAFLLRETLIQTELFFGQNIERLRVGMVFRDARAAPLLAIIPAGSFQMGSPVDEEDRDDDGRDDDEGPQHAVRIELGFALGCYPVTFEEYDRFAAATAREPPGDQDWGRGRRPVINVSWEDAQAYTAWLSKQTGQPYRLPSEAEWEYACRAETTTRYSFGDSFTPEQANYRENVGKTTEVGRYPANAWRLYDMHGNVWEWCADVWHESYDGVPDDGSAWLDGGSQGRRVLRGGSWHDIPGLLRSACRGRAGPGVRDGSIGFRVARTLP